MSISATTEENAEHLLSAEEVRQHLGVSRTFIYRLLAKGAIPSVRIGRLRKVRATDLQTFIEERLEGGDE